MLRARRCSERCCRRMPRKTGGGWRCWPQAVHVGVAALHDGLPIDSSLQAEPVAAAGSGSR